MSTAEKTSKYEIEIGVPIPPIVRNPELLNLAGDMIVSSSVLFSKEKEAKSFRRVLRSLGFKSTLRPDGDGFRVWKGEERAS